MQSNSQVTTVSKKVAFYECDYKKRLRLSQILKYAAEIAGFDFTCKGYSHQYLFERGMVFLVSKVSFHIFSYPCDQQSINVSTWIEGTKGAEYLRCFEITDEDGNPLVQGKSRWILVEPEKRKIIRPSAVDFGEMETLEKENAALAPEKIKCDDLKLIGSRDIRISDIDANGHVYNAVYSDIAVDFLGLNEYASDVDNFRINFINEAKLGDVINIYISYGGKRAVITGMCEEKKCFETEFLFK